MSSKWSPKQVNLMISALLITLIVALDQAVKIWARAALPGRSFSYLGGVFQVEYAENRGAFLSLGASLSDGARTLLFVFGATLMLLFCVYMLWKSAHHRFAVISFSLVIAGGVGNLIDRVFRGSVTDFVHMGFGSLRTGIVNVADVAITFGFFFLLILQYRPERKSDEGDEAVSGDSA